MKPFSQGIIFLIIATMASLYYLHKLNLVTEMKLEIPKIEKKLKTLDEEIEELRFEIERVESPQFLEELMKNPDLPLFLYPKESEVIFR